MTKFNQELMDRWLEALDNQEFPQTTSYLKTTTGDCCLGVLCELHPNLEFENAGQEGFTDGSQFKLKWKNGRLPKDRNSFLPPTVAKELNLHRKLTNEELEQVEEELRDELLNERTRQHALAMYNDYEFSDPQIGFSHPQIADKVREFGWDKP